MYNLPILEFLNMGGGEIAIIMVAILLLFGGKKLPELAKGLGKGIREFKDASEGVKREIHRNINAIDVDEEDRKADAARSYQEPDYNSGYNIHDPEVSTEEVKNDTHTPEEENKEPKSSV
jgi:sec-independent protein translocase protein TatA